jgi:hypothetical protein
MKFCYLYLPLLQFVLSHGFIYSVEDNLVRGLSKLNSVIDDLRNPDATQCRNEPVTINPMAIDLTQSTLTVKLAISKLATHIGNCWINILDENNNSIRVSPLEKCVYFIPDSECIPVPNSSTNDMCLQTWTFPLQNIDQLTCNKCVLNWWWRAEHIVPNEIFNNCIDFTLNTPNNNTPPIINTPTINTPTIKPIINKPTMNTPMINTPNDNTPPKINKPNTNFNTNSNIKSLIKNPLRRPYIRPTSTDCP